jgi:hypothetical protein
MAEVAKLIAPSAVVSECDMVPSQKRYACHEEALD